MTLVKALDGTTNLHIWREGPEYLEQHGDVFLRQWNNVIFATSPGPPLENTKYLDLSASDLDFADDTFDAVYAYHVFEHLTTTEGDRCARELFRVLRPGSVCRISVPDLEEACRDYLAALHAAANEPTEQNLVRYRWAVMVIFEQMVRERSGGLMSEAICRGDYDAAQLRHSYGDSLQPLIESVRAERSPHPPQTEVSQRRSLRGLMGGIYRRIFRGSRHDHSHPRSTKEAVRWMYDRVSLKLLLERAGFQHIRRVDHRSSGIRGWASYDFDRSKNGDYPLDPSVYLEGVKPPR